MSQLFVRDGVEDNITSIVVAVTSVVRVCPVFERVRLYELITLQNLVSKGLGVETSIFTSPKNKKLENKGILICSSEDENVSKKLLGADGGLYKSETPILP